MPAGHDPRCPRPTEMVPGRWNRLSDAGHGRFLRAMDPGLISLDRLRHQTGRAQASVPRPTPAQPTARARRRRNKTRRALAAELGTGPGPALAGLLQQILHRDPRLEPRPPASGPGRGMADRRSHGVTCSHHD